MISRQIGWTQKSNLLYEVLRGFTRLTSVVSAKIISLIVNIINSITGESDTTYEDATSSLVIMYGGTGGGTVLENLNELDVILGGPGGFTTNLSALNDIDILSGGTGNHASEYSAWVSLLTLVNYPGNAIVTTLTGDYIVSVDGKYILTVDGFVPLNAMRTLTGEPVVTINNEYITI